MKRLLAIVVLSLNACGTESLPANAVNALANHVPPVVFHAQALGPVPAAQAIELHVVLPGQDPAGLDDYLTGLFDPNSALFHQYLTPDAYHARYDPSEAQAAVARAALTALGLNVEPEVRGSYLVAHTDISTAERVFQTSMVRYMSANGTPFSAPSKNITMPAGLNAEAIVGLNMMPVPRPAAAVQVKAEAPMGAAALRQALQIPPTATGAGVVVGIIGEGGYNVSDTQAFYTANKLPATADVKNVLLAGDNGADTADVDAEFDLDIQTIVAMAPDANIRVYIAPATGSFTTMLMTVFAEAASPTVGDKLLPRIINASYAGGESQFAQADIQSLEPIFKRLASQGQTVYAATGDNGSSGHSDNPVKIEASYPASSAWVVAVGGTYLAVDVAGNYAGETTWYNNNPQAPTGTGGGISSVIAIPSWQKAAVNPASKGSTAMRNIPDISANADPNSGVAVYANGQVFQAGGTSLAAPEWSAFQAIIEQMRAANGLEPLGFAAPALYYVASGQNYSTLFHDIADGSGNGTYNAVTGLDNCTGFGTFTPALLQAMASGYAQKAFNGAGWLTPKGAP